MLKTRHNQNTIHNGKIVSEPACESWNELVAQILFRKREFQDNLLKMD